MLLQQPSPKHVLSLWSLQKFLLFQVLPKVNMLVKCGDLRADQGP